MSQVFDFDRDAVEVIKKFMSMRGRPVCNYCGEFVRDVVAQNNGEAAHAAVETESINGETHKKNCPYADAVKLLAAHSDPASRPTRLSTYNSIRCGVCGVPYAGGEHGRVSPECINTTRETGT